MKKSVSIGVIALAIILLTLNFYQYNANLQLQREIGGVYLGSIGNLKLNTGFILDYLTNNEPLDKARVDFYTTKLNELELIALPQNSVFLAYVGAIHSNFSKVSEKLKSEDLKTKECPEFVICIQELKLLKNGLDEINKIYGNNALECYKMCNNGDKRYASINSKLLKDLNSILNKGE